MCGIAGTLSFNNTNKDLSHITNVMSQKLAHRGPNAMGFYEEPEISLGHRRLSIIDLNEVANQPMTDHTKRYTIVFNGEIYNFKDIKQKLDYPFITNGDTEVLLAAYITWGAKCLEHLNGMFAFAIWDSLKKELFLARDRMAVKPIYYFKNDEYFIFASELTAILATGIPPKKLSKPGLIDYLAYQSVHAPNTIIENIFQLCGGEYAVLSKDTFTKSTYWDLLNPSKKIEVLSYKQAQDLVKVQLAKSIKLRMVSDVPVGVFLSGGIDSGTITALASQNSNQPINTVTIGFDDKTFDESYYAKITAEKFKTNHTNFTLLPNDFLNQLPNIVDSLYSPSSDGPNTYMASMVAKKLGLTVIQSGLGGDELFAGYPLFKQIKFLLKNKWIWLTPKFLYKILGEKISARQAAKFEHVISNKHDLANIYSNFRQIMTKATMSKILSDNMENALSYDWVIEKITSKKQALSQLPFYSQISYCELVSYTQSVLLKDSDQMSMANSIELREPFFDYELIELLLQIPDKYKPTSSVKKLLVDSLNNLLPTAITNKKKQTFTFPWEQWLKNELKKFCDESITICYNYPEYFNKNSLSDYYNDFQNGNTAISWSEIWALVVLGRWLKKNDII